MLSFLIQDTIDELDPKSEEYKVIKQEAENMGYLCENIIANVYQVENFRKSTYLQELTSKVDSLIRNNFQIDPQNEKQI